MFEARLRTRASDAEVRARVGKLLTDNDYDMTVNPEGGPVRLLKPSGAPLLVYLPKAIPADLRRSTYPALHRIRAKTDNRGYASGGRRAVRTGHDGARSRALPVSSNIVGYMEDTPSFGYCRLTAYTAHEVSGWSSIRPLFEFIGEAFAEHVPDRYGSQMAYVRRTQPEWVVPGTPFTTITVNNTWSTAVHTDKGDLQEGFSNLAVFRRGDFSGGVLVFPEYRVGVAMADRDLLLMDAHEWHGNTPMMCNRCGQGPLREYGHKCGLTDTVPERISIVAYYRTKVAECGTAAEEQAKAMAASERRSQ